jgi:hypothetical protein
MFFFEKKNQKTFICLRGAAWYRTSVDLRQIIPQFARAREEGALLLKILGRRARPYCRTS